MSKMEVDRRAFIASLGGVAAVSLMSHEDRAEALEHYMIEEIEQQGATSQSQSGSSIYRKPAKARGTGTVFRMDDLEEMPAQPTLMDFYKTRFRSSHVIRSATHAIDTGQPERTVFACLIHDVTQSLCRSDHGWWGGQLFEPYVDERVSWAVRYHQALRSFPTPAWAMSIRRCTTVSSVWTTSRRTTSSKPTKKRSSTRTTWRHVWSR